MRIEQLGLRLFVQLGPVQLDGAEGTFVVRTYGRSFLLLDDATRSALESMVNDNTVEGQAVLIMMINMITKATMDKAWHLERVTSKDIVWAAQELLKDRDPKYISALRVFMEAFDEGTLSIFSPEHWLRAKDSGRD